MAVELFKLVLSASTTTDAKPTVSNYFGTNPTAINATSAVYIGRTNFVTDSGAAVTAFGSITTNNGYYQLYISGQLQQTALYTVNTSVNGTGGITLATTTAAKVIALSAPITLALTNFAPTSSTTVTS